MYIYIYLFTHLYICRYISQTVEHAGFVPLDFEGKATKFAPNMALKSIARGKLTFDDRVVRHRVAGGYSRFSAARLAHECRGTSLTRKRLRTRFVSGPNETTVRSRDIECLTISSGVIRRFKTLHHETHRFITWALQSYLPP